MNAMQVDQSVAEWVPALWFKHIANVSTNRLFAPDSQSQLSFSEGV